ncbi:MAG: 2-C-methyl-D-erythritol 4-phosphate cytidylyltransferase [Gammaproteobacteria bacterium]
MQQASAIIVAAGSGTRLGSALPKAFVPLAGRTILSYSLRTLANVQQIVELILTAPAGMEQAARAEVTAAGLELPAKITVGGTERQESVRIALALTSAESELVVVHDAARPFASPELFQRCLGQAEWTGAAIAAIPVADTLKRVDQDGRIVATLARAGLWQAQTPQAFRRQLLIEAHELALRDQIVATDDADLVEWTGHKVEVVEGSPLNLKITTADDLKLAEALALRLYPR